MLELRNVIEEALTQASAASSQGQQHGPRLIRIGTTAHELRLGQAGDGMADGRSRKLELACELPHRSNARPVERDDHLQLGRLPTLETATRIGAPVTAREIKRG